MSIVDYGISVGVVASRLLARHLHPSPWNCVWLLTLRRSLSLKQASTIEWTQGVYQLFNWLLFDTSPRDRFLLWIVRLLRLGCRYGPFWWEIHSILRVLKILCLKGIVLNRNYRD
jgi:hypothetical protein